LAAPSRDRFVAAHPDAVAAVLLSGVTLLVFQNAIRDPARLLQEDIALQWAGLHAAANEQIHQGRFPHWNPYGLTGQRLFADIGLGLLYPGSFLFRVFPFPTACLWTFLIHFTGAALATCACARKILAASTPASFAAGAIFAFGGFALGHTNHLNFVLSVPYLPLLFLATVQMHRLKTRRLRWWIVGVLCATMMILSGGIPILFLAAVMMAWLLLTLALIESPTGGRLRTACRLALMTAALFGAACGLSAVQLIPTANLYLVSARSAWKADEIGLGAIPWQTLLIQALSPAALGDLVTLAIPHLDHETAFFIGGSGLSFALLAIWTRRRTAWAKALLALLGISVFLSLRQIVDALGLQAHIPIKVRQPARFIGLAHLALALLAAIGLDRWRLALRQSFRGPAYWLPAAVSGAMLLTTIAVLSWLGSAGDSESSVRQWLAGRSASTRKWLSDIDPSRWSMLTVNRPLTRTLAMTGWCLAGAASTVIALGLRRRASMASCIVCGVLAGECALYSSMTWAGQPRGQAIDPRGGPFIEFLRENLDGGRYFLGAPFPPLWGNQGAVHGLSSATAYIGSMLNVSPEHAVLMDPARSEVSMQILTLYGAKYILLHETTAAVPFPIAFQSAGYRIHLNPLYLSRAFFVNRVEPVPDSATALQLVTRDSFDPRAVAFLSAIPKEAALPGSDNANTDTASTCAIRRDQPGDMLIEVECRPERWLFLSVSYDQGWAATIDQQPLPIHRANAAFMAVEVPPGRHLIHLRYQTPGLRAGLAISVITIAGLAILILAVKRGWMRSHDGPRPTGRA